MKKRLNSKMELYSKSTDKSMSYKTKEIYMSKIKITSSNKLISKNDRDNCENIKLRPLTNYYEKRVWINRFNKQNKDFDKRNLSNYEDDGVYLVASDEQQEIGFVHLKKDHFYSYPKKKPNYTVVSEIFVKTPYRQTDVCWWIIEKCVREHEVQLISVTLDLYEEHISVYEKAGFSRFRTERNVDLGYAVHDSVNLPSDLFQMTTIKA